MQTECPICEEETLLNKRNLDAAIASRETRICENCYQEQLAMFAEAQDEQNTMNELYHLGKI